MNSSRLKPLPQYEPGHHEPPLKLLQIRDVQSPGSWYDGTMNIEQVIQIFWQMDIVPLDQNPECADYDNPRGYRYGYRGFVIAEAADGSRWVFHRYLDNYLEANVAERLDTFVAHVQRAIDAGQKLDPTLWEETRPGYGSDAYIQGGWSMRDREEERSWD